MTIFVVTTQDSSYPRTGAWADIASISATPAQGAKADAAQAALVSGTNIKTVNGSAILGSGDLVVSGSAAWGAVTGTLADQTDLQAALDAKLSSIAAAWPIGAVFISVVSTNPATLLGFGTWSAFGAGRVLVSLDSGDTDFDAAEETGGVKTVTLSAAQSGLPQHTHTQNSHNHTQDAHVHTQRRNNTATGANSGWTTAFDASSSSPVADANTGTGSTTATNQAATATNQDAGPTAASSAHTNLQPYIVVYMFKRTA